MSKHRFNSEWVRVISRKALFEPVVFLPGVEFKPAAEPVRAGAHRYAAVESALDMHKPIKYSKDILRICAREIRPRGLVSYLNYKWALAGEMSLREMLVCMREAATTMNVKPGYFDQLGFYLDTMLPGDFTPSRILDFDGDHVSKAAILERFPNVDLHQTAESDKSYDLVILYQCLHHYPPERQTEIITLAKNASDYGVLLSDCSLDDTKTTELANIIHLIYEGLFASSKSAETKHTLHYSDRQSLMSLMSEGGYELTGVSQPVGQQCNPLHQYAVYYQKNDTVEF